MKVAAYTLGCKVNQYDTNAMVELLEREGFTRVSFHDDADVYLINTCTVTNIADKKSRNMIRRIHHLHPRALVCVCGCLAQRDSEKIMRIEGVGAVIGTEDRSRIVEIVKGALAGERVDWTRDISAINAFEEMTVSSGGELTRGYIKIQEGCNHFCSYCIIPYVRGRVRSRPEESILAEAEALARNHVKEIVLTGIHISSYGQDGGGSLLSMLRALNGVRGVRRVRLGSLEPHILEPDFLAELTALEKICPHFHVSLQSGSDGVLKRMNRRYTAARFAGYLDNIRAVFDRPAITTDIIAGFPGETEKEFGQTCRFAREQGFSRIHVFPYSEREGTPAARMEGSVPMKLRRERANALIGIGRELEEAYARQFIGTRQDVLFERQAEDGLAEGYTDRYLRVRAPAREGSYETVRLSEYGNGVLYAD